MADQPHLIVALTGASGAYATEMLLNRAPWPTTLIVSDWGRKVFERECGPYERLMSIAARVHDNRDMMTPPASGSVPNVGMVVLPCSVNTMGQIAAGMGENLITRAAHCQLKERRPLILCLRETPLSLIDLKNCVRVAEAGGIIMPLAPPFWMHTDNSVQPVTLHDVLGAYVDRVLRLLGHPLRRTWEDLL